MMVKKIDSDALGDVKASLGLTGAGAPVTELTDGVVDQALVINELARRGRTLAATGGIFAPTLRNVHGAAETLSNTVNPYNIGTAGVVPPYPAVVPPLFDFWLLGASIRRASGTGTLIATLSITIATPQAGWGLDDSGVQVLVSQKIRLALWNNLNTDDTVFAGLSVGNEPHAYFRYRLPRIGSRIVFVSTSSALASFDLQLMVGLFPVSLGQDALI